MSASPYLISAGAVIVPGPPASGPGSGSVTSVASGPGLTGGPITSAGTLSITAATLGALDLSTLATSNPGSGKLWLNGGVVQVGA